MAVLGSALATLSPACAQTVSPMEKIHTSFTDKYVVQITIRNPYANGQLSEIEIYSEDWRPVRGAVLSHKSAYLGGGENLQVTALVPFHPGRKTRYVYICHAITPKSGGRGAAYRGEVCGKYSAIQLS